MRGAIFPTIRRVHAPDRGGGDGIADISDIVDGAGIADFSDEKQCSVLLWRDPIIKERLFAIIMRAGRCPTPT